MNIAELVGKRLVRIEGGAVGSEEIVFATDDGTRYKMFHEQDCCESVVVEDICGEVSDLLDSPIVQAEESASEEHPENLPQSEWQADSCTWTFYRLATIKGRAVIRWCGSSNGYYSESVEFEKCCQG